MTPEFEWITREIEDEEGERTTRHYFIDPSGQLRASIDEPCGGRLTYNVDIMWSESRYSNWIYLSLAKSHIEQSYSDMIRRKPKLSRPRRMAKK